MIYDLLDPRPETESSSSLPVKGYSKNRKDMEDIALLLDLNSGGTSARVSMNVLRELILAIRTNKTLREFFFRVTVNPVVPDGVLVVPAGVERKDGMSA